VSEQPGAVVRTLFEAWDRGDREAVIDLTDPGIVIDATRRVFNPTTYEGKDGVRSMIDDLSEVWQEMRSESTEFIEGEDGRVAVLGRMVAKGRGSGVETSRLMAHVWTVRDGRVVRWELGFDDEADALKAAGLSASRRKLR
jgi:ketosteroid isomerase-like protein